jgi:hypothetical protein
MLERERLLQQQQQHQSGRPVCRRRRRTVHRELQNIDVDDAKRARLAHYPQRRGVHAGNNENY